MVVHRMNWPISLMMAASNSALKFTIWQWNCWGFSQKRAVLQQFLRSKDLRPQIILLQEVLADRVCLSGYKSYVKKGPQGRGVSTLVNNKHTFIEHDLNMGRCKIEYLFGEVIPSGELKQSVFILNVYSSPRGRQHRFTSLLAKVVSMAGRARAPIRGF